MFAPLKAKYEARWGPAINRLVGISWRLSVALSTIYLALPNGVPLESEIKFLPM